jgi:hypothetical protein
MNPGVQAINSAIHKSPDWAHEQEWRIVDTTGDDLPGKEWLMPTPSRVLLVHRMAPEWRRQVVEIAGDQSIPVFDVSPSRRDQFDLDVKPVV